jgi:5-(carboxyamino)imidazole ribonucleotide mutase
MPAGKRPVAIIMGSKSDWKTMRHAAAALKRLKVGFVARVVSAHRTPDRLYKFAKGARDEGFKVVIAGAGGAAHLPGMLASVTTLPVIGVPVPLANLDGLDSLLSIVQMPAGIPVATVSIGGARNAGLLAARMLSTSDERLAAALAEYAAGLERVVAEKNDSLRRSRER